jgi:type I restriction-modification system DNA methylase subunit
VKPSACLLDLFRADRSRKPLPTAGKTLEQFEKQIKVWGVELVLANGIKSSNTSGEAEIRKAIIEADLVDCMVALPGQLFYSTQIPVCLWFFSRNKAGAKNTRERRGEVIFIDARKMGTLIDRSIVISPPMLSPRSPIHIIG